MNEHNEKSEFTHTEEFEISGEKLIETVKKLVAEGNVRRLIIKKPDGESLLEVPLTTGIVVGGAMMLLAPVLAALGALAALIAKVRIAVVRQGPAAPASSDPESSRRG